MKRTAAGVESSISAIVGKCALMGIARPCPTVIPAARPVQIVILAVRPVQIVILAARSILHHVESATERALTPGRTQVIAVVATYYARP